MLVSRNGARKRVVIDLGRGATAHAVTLDAFAVRAIAAETRAEWNRLRAGEAPLRQWPSISPATLNDMREDEAVANQVFDWMHAVLTAAASVVQLDGVEECDGFDDAGAPINLRALPASFEAFELLFLDGEAEVRFRLASPSLERVWAQEKNASASAPIGFGAEAESSATPAAMPETPAPEAASDSSPPDSSSSAETMDAAPAPSAPTPPEPPKASLPGSLPAPAPGNSPEA